MIRPLIGMRFLLLPLVAVTLAGCGGRTDTAATGPASTVAPLGSASAPATADDDPATSDPGRATPASASTAAGGAVTTAATGAVTTTTAAASDPGTVPALAAVPEAEVAELERTLDDIDQILADLQAELDQD